MKIIKLEHSGIAIEKNGETLVFDPVEFTEKIPVLKNVVAIIITHKHSDHLQPEVISRILLKNPAAQVFTTSDAVSNVKEAVVAKAGESYRVGGFKLDFFGKDHAAIIPGQIPCENIGVVVDEKVINPGDSFDLPDLKPEVLFVPIAAPWSKVSESIDFVKKANPSVAIPVHDAVLSELGKKFNNNWVGKACDEIGAKLIVLEPNESIDLPPAT